MIFRAGDTVQLKSGGPTMTVEDDDDIIPSIASLRKVPTVKCVWFAGAVLKRAEFQEDSLKPASPKLALVKDAAKKRR